MGGVMETERFRRLLREHDRAVRVCVETGTFKGDTTWRAAEVFEIVHTIELTEHYFQYARSGLIRQGRWPNIHFYHGDSTFWVPVLSQLHWDEPVLWYLDAHWFKDVGDRERTQMPLWKELQAIAIRTQRDIIVVDDTHAFGRDDDDWRDVTIQRIVQTLPERRIVETRELKDELAIWMRP